MENLPEEIATEIFVRLPVESIIRCKSVRKSWYVLISNPNFVANHLAYQHQYNNNLMFLKRWHYDSDTDDPDTDEPPGHQTMCIFSKNDVDDPETSDLPLSIQLCGYGLTLIGHCDGLIAFSDRKEGIFVCNPATREFRTLPNSSLGPTIPYDRIVTHGDDGAVNRSACNKFLGFGYDCVSKDYKIVRVVSFSSWTSAGGLGKQMHRVEVFCIRTDACWRELNVTLDSLFIQRIGVPYFDDSYIGEPYYDGVCYWRAIDDRTCFGDYDACDNVLISFHLADEVFRKITLPTLDFVTRVSIGVYNKSMALFVYPGGDERGRIDIWVMKEFGVEGSWSKLFTVKPSFTDACERYFGFWNGSDKELIYADLGGQLAIYNCVTTESKTLLALSIKPIKAGGEVHYWTKIPYMKTIVSVKSML